MDTPDSFVEFPSDLKKFNSLEIQQLCRDYRLSIVSQNKWQLIGRLLVAFPPSSVTPETLAPFSEEELSHMCSGAWISNRGSKSDLIQHLINYTLQDTQLFGEPQTRQQTDPKEMTFTSKSNISHVMIPKKREISVVEEAVVGSPKPKKQKCMDPRQFLEMAPALPVTIENQYYELLPEIFSENDFGWKKEGKQVIKVGGNDFSASWKLSITVVKEENI